MLGVFVRSNGARRPLPAAVRSLAEVSLDSCGLTLFGLIIYRPTLEPGLAPTMARGRACANASALICSL